MSEWQPIETAPKDGRHILAIWMPWDKSKKVEAVYWDGFWIFSQDGDSPTESFQPTHWAPLELPK